MTQANYFLAALGDILFEPKKLPIQSVTIDSTYGWKQTDLINRGSTHHFTGIVTDKITVAGILYTRASGDLAGFFDLFQREPSDAMDRLRALARKGNPVPFALAANGKAIPLGVWAITNVHEKQSLFLKNGTPQKVEFTMQLTRVGDGKN